MGNLLKWLFNKEPLMAVQEAVEIPEPKMTVDEGVLKSLATPPTAEEKATSWISTLKIILVNGQALSWEVEHSGDTRPGQFPWKDFYKWFSSKPGSTSFHMTHSKGITIFMRKDIMIVEYFKWSKR